MIPSETEALALHAKLGSNNHIINHCKTVARIAQTLARRFKDNGINLDEDSVYAAALLHDIGRNKTNTIAHGYVGAQIMRENGVDESVVSIIQRHVGAGISSDEAKNMGFPEGDYFPRTLEERIVCFSDKVAGRGKVLPFQVEIDKFRKKGLDVKRLKELKASLERDLGEDPELILTQFAM
jgi:uncharacterized protein (TIGR00295 family)